MRELGRTGSAYGDFRINAVSARKRRSRRAASKRTRPAGPESKPFESIPPCPTMRP